MPFINKILRLGHQQTRKGSLSRSLPGVARLSSKVSHSALSSTYQTRFFKCVKSALLFGQTDYGESMKKFALLLEKENRLHNLDEEAFRIKKLFNFPGTESKKMPSPRYK